MKRTDSPGSHQITRSSVFRLVVPIMLGSLTLPLMGLTDTAVVGRLGSAAMLGGLAVGAVLIDLIFTGLNFLRSGTVGLTAQALGGGDTVERNAVLHRVMLLSVAIGLLLIMFSAPLLNIGLAVMAPGAEVAAAVGLYFSIRILAAPFTLLNFSILGWLLGLARVREGLILQIISSGSNIALSIYLGLVRGGGIQGVAWATVMSELLATLLGLALVYRHDGFGWQGWRRLIDRGKLTILLTLNRDIMIRSLILLLAFSYFTMQGSRLGEITLAANAVLFNFFLLSAFMLDGFAMATEQLVGRAVGARNVTAFDAALRVATFWSALLSLVLSAVLILLGPMLIALLTTNPEVREAAGNYLIWAAMTGVFGVLAFQMDGVFIGATWSIDMRNMMLLSAVVYLLVCWVAIPLWHNHGLWFALEIFLAVRGVSLLSRLKARRAVVFAIPCAGKAGIN